jgi:ribosomal protein L7/L12
MTLIREYSGMGLREAKQAVDGLLDGKEIRFRISEEAEVPALKRRIEDVGGVCTFES